MRLFYTYGFLSNSGLWLGVWIKYLLDERGLELKWLLLMDLPFWLVTAALQAPTGALADHIGRKRVLAISGVAYALTIAGFGITTNYWMLFADYMLWAVALATQTGADQALVFDSLRAAGQGHRFQPTIGRWFAITVTATLLGITLGGFVASATSLAFTVQVSAVFPLLAAGAAWMMIEPPRAARERHYWRDMQAALQFAWRHPQVRYTLLTGSVLLTAAFGPVVLIQPFLIHHNVETSLFGVFQAPVRLFAVLAALGAASAALRVGRQNLLAASGLAMAASYIGLAAVNHVGAFAIFALPAIAQSLMNPTISSHLNERVPAERRATVLSLMQLGFALQVAWFEPALGFFTDDVSLTAAFVFAAVYCLLVMPPLFILWRRAHPGGVRSAPAPAFEGAPGG